MIITLEQLEQHKAIDNCWICKTQFNFKKIKVKHHDHFTGKYHSSICSDCNMQIKNSIKIPVFFHNMDASQCGNHRPGFGLIAVTPKNCDYIIL